jgi:hypothetical protein
VKIKKQISGQGTSEVHNTSFQKLHSKEFLRPLTSFFSSSHFPQELPLGLKITHIMRRKAKDGNLSLKALFLRFRTITYNCFRNKVIILPLGGTNGTTSLQKTKTTYQQFSKETKGFKEVFRFKLYAAYLQALGRMRYFNTAFDPMEMGKLKESQSNAKSSAIKSIISGIPSTCRRSNSLINPTKSPSSVPPKEGFFFLLLRWASHFYPFSNLKEAL